MDMQIESQVYSPELAPRRSEFIVWSSALLVNGSWILLVIFGQKMSLWLLLLGIPLFLIALGISLANWMDRHTKLSIDSDGIYFSNSLRRVQLKWQEIQEVRVLPAQWGKKVQVFGDRSYFGFHTLGEVQAHGKILGRTGFMDGERMLRQILDGASLSEVRQVDVGGQLEGYYYSRE